MGFLNIIFYCNFMLEENNMSWVKNGLAVSSKCIRRMVKSNSMSNLREGEC